MTLTPPRGNRLAAPNLSRRTPPPNALDLSSHGSPGGGVLKKRRRLWRLNPLTFLRRFCQEKLNQWMVWMSNVAFDYPYRCMSIFSLTTLILVCAVFTAKVETNVYNMYAMPDTPSMLDRELVREIFPANGYAALLMVAPDGVFEEVKKTGRSSRFIVAPEFHRQARAVDNFLRETLTATHHEPDGAPHLLAWLDSESLDVTKVQYSQICNVLRKRIRNGHDEESNSPREGGPPVKILNEFTPDSFNHLNRDVVVESAGCAFSNPIFSMPRGAQLRSSDWPNVAKPYGGAANVEISLPGLEYKKMGRRYQLTGAKSAMAMYQTRDSVQAESWQRAVVQLVRATSAAKFELLGEFPNEFGALSYGRDSKLLRDVPRRPVNLIIKEAPVIVFSSEGSVKGVGWVEVFGDSFTFPSDWEVRATDLIIDVSLLSLHVDTSGSWCEELVRSTSFNVDVMVLYTGALLIIMIYTSFSFSSFDKHRSKTIFGPAATVAAAFGFLAGIGFCYCCGMHHTATMNAVPFLVMGIGVDDAFVLSSSYQLTYFMKPRTDDEREEVARRRVVSSVKSAGTAITLTTATNLVSFGVGGFTPYMATRNFCLASFMGLLMGYFGIFLFFVPVMTLCAKYELSGINLEEGVDVETGDLRTIASNANNFVNSIFILRDRQRTLSRATKEIVGTDSDEGEDDFRATLQRQKQTAQDSFNSLRPPKGTVGRILLERAPWMVSVFLRSPVVLVLMLFVSLALAAFLSVYAFQVEMGLATQSLIPPDSYLQSMYAELKDSKMDLAIGEISVEMMTSDSDDFIRDVKMLRKTVTPLIRNLIDPIEEYTEWVISKDHAWRDDGYEIDDFPDDFWVGFNAFVYGTIRGKHVTSLIDWGTELTVPGYLTESFKKTLDEGKMYFPNHLRFMYVSEFRESVVTQSEDFRLIRDAIYEINSKATAFRITLAHPLYAFFEADTKILRQTLMSMGWALLGVLMVAGLLLEGPTHMGKTERSLTLPAYIIIVLSVVILIDSGIFGIMSLVGIQLNIVTMMCLVMSIGFAVDYTFHTVHCFCLAEGSAVRRIAVATLLVGLPLCQSLISTLGAALPLVKRIDYIYSVFFHMIIIVLASGFFFGTILLPLLLSAVNSLVERVMKLKAYESSDDEMSHY